MCRGAARERDSRPSTDEPGAWGKTRAGFDFRTEIDRREGGKWNQAIETGGVLVANKVRVEGEVRFVRQGDA